jgi:hypothetical protein
LQAENSQTKPMTEKVIGQNFYVPYAWQLPVLVFPIPLILIPETGHRSKLTDYVKTKANQANASG